MIDSTRLGSHIKCTVVSYRCHALGVHSRSFEYNNSFEYNLSFEYNDNITVKWRVTSSSTIKATSWPCPSFGGNILTALDFRIIHVHKLEIVSAIWITCMQISQLMYKALLFEKAFRLLRQREASYIFYIIL